MSRVFGIGIAICLVLGIALPLTQDLAYFYFAGYVILQYVILATAWNILGGFAGYVNFGVGAFFAIGAYTSAMFGLRLHVGLPIALLASGVMAGIFGFALGALTLRLRGVYFAIATLALSIVLLTVIVNTPALGGAKGIYIHRPKTLLLFPSYLAFLFALMVVLAVGAVIIARLIEHSRIGRGLAAVRDNESAAAAMGVPVFRLKLFATVVSGFLMGIAGAPFPYYITYMEPYGAMSLDVTVNSLAMPLIGGTTTWLGPVVGAILLGSVQQAVTVTVSSEFNLLIVGVLLVAFVVLAPEGIVGLLARWRQRGISS